LLFFSKVKSLLNSVLLFGMLDGRNCKGWPMKRWVDNILKWCDWTDITLHTTVSTPRSGSCDMEGPHGWPLWFFNRRKRKRRSSCL